MPRYRIKDAVRSRIKEAQRMKKEAPEQPHSNKQGEMGNPGDDENMMSRDSMNRDRMNRDYRGRDYQADVEAPEQPHGDHQGEEDADLTGDFDSEQNYRSRRRRSRRRNDNMKEEEDEDEEDSMDRDQMDKDYQANVEAPEQPHGDHQGEEDADLTGDFDDGDRSHDRRGRDYQTTSGAIPTQGTRPGSEEQKR